jgi:hypothetical protein
MRPICPRENKDRIGRWFTVLEFIWGMSAKTSFDEPFRSYAAQEFAKKPAPSPIA